ncbi:hypothetical protein [Vallitalea okinawensis]|uniref:hypothetical protein n=1 Tax=Vallitalea okinawensis TaxID=2078660 RepID=UPI000CFC3523|nr:hypothetical protein [Vallitalea okinawensis]
MNREQLCDIINKSKIIENWHWFGYNFGFGITKRYTRFSNALVDALLIIDSKIDGYAIQMVKRIESYNNREKDIGHYEQLIQICGEIYVLKQAVIYFSGIEDISFENEPTSMTSNKNPEFIINLKGYKYGIEVKVPSLVNHINKRKENSFQLIGRMPGMLETAKKISGTDQVTLPRDNPVKSFLQSADSKFEGFKKEHANFISILFILWDDYINEPIGALLTEPSGLLLEGSFARKDDKRIEFKYVDYIFLDRPMTNFVEDAAGRNLVDGKMNCFDYGTVDKFPHKIIIKNPDAESVVIHDEIIDCFQVKENSPYLGAEYNPSDMVMWL